MKINQNNDISVYRGETAAIDFKMSQRSDYYVPFLISSARVNPMVCISIGSTRRETKNIVSKQLWLDLTNQRKFTQTVVTDLGQINDVGLTIGQVYSILLPIIEAGILYQFTKKTEVDAGNSQLHFVYSVVADGIESCYIDEYDFTVIMAIDDGITLDMTNGDYFYQIELMDTVPMLTHLVSLIDANLSLIAKLPTAFAAAYTANKTTAVTTYLAEVIALVTKTWPTHWGYRILDPLTSPVASVSNIQMLQPPRKFTVQSVIK